MRRTPRPYLALLFVLVMTTIWYARNPPDPRASRALLDAQAQLRAYYREKPPAGGWAVDGITISEQTVWVDVLPPRASTPFHKLDYDVQVRRLAAFCPDPGDLAWRLLAPSQTVEVRAATSASGQPTAVDCRVPH